MANGRRSIYSSRQAMAPGTYDNPVADFLDRLPGYIQNFQKNQLELGKMQLLNKRYDDEQAYIKERDALADRRYTEEQKIKADAVDEEARRYKTAQERLNKKEASQAARDEVDLMSNVYSKGDPRYINWALNRARVDGDGESIGNLTSIQKENEDFQTELSSLYSNVNTSGSLRSVPRGQLMVEEFMKKHKDNPNFTVTSPAYTNVIKMKNQLGARVAQIPGGLVPPDEWENTFGPAGRDAKLLLDGLDDQVEAKITQKGVVQELSAQKQLDKDIQELQDSKKKIINEFKIGTLDNLREDKALARAENIPTATSDRTVADVLAAARTFDPDVVQEPSITEVEMDDVSKQIATQNEIETNIAKINESIPGLETTTAADTTAITDEDVVALTGDDAEDYDPNRVGLDPNTVPASFLTPITDDGGTEEVPEGVDETPTMVETTPDVDDSGASGVGGAILNRLLPDQVSASTLPDTSVVGQNIGDLLSGSPEGETLPSKKETTPVVKGESAPLQTDLYKPTVETGEITDRKREMIENANKTFAQNDPEFMKSTKIAEDIYTSNIRDLSGNRFDLLDFSDFDKKINAMRKRVISINKNPKTDPKALRTNPQDKLQLKQLLLEQRQLVNDLNELQSQLNSTSEYFYFPHKNYAGKQTGRLTRKSTNQYKKSINSVLKNIPKQLRFIDQIN